MSVIVIADACNLSCEYCFYSTVMWAKKEEMVKKGILEKDKVFFNVDELKKMADRIKDSDTTIDIEKRSIVISWGEPTLHPEFIEIMQYFIRKGFSIHLLTNFTFQPKLKIAKFLKKNMKHFRFLVNFNEIWKQRMAINTKENILQFDYEHLKLGINLYHPDFNFEDIIYILQNTTHIKTLRIGLPNAQADEGINMGIIAAMKKCWVWEDTHLDLYKRDLFQEDIETIKTTWEGIKYGLLDPKVYDFYYNELWGALLRLINELETKKDINWTLLADKVDFYIDCWFDYKILPKYALGFMLQRLLYKNPCSIPNGVCIQLWWNTQQCYTLWFYWDFAHIQPSSYTNSIWEINKFYILSAQFMQNWLLSQLDELWFEMCRGNNLRFFKQLFTQWTFNKGNFIVKDYNISIVWDEKLGYQLKDVKDMTSTYINAFKETKNKVFLYRVFSLFEYCLVHWYLKEWEQVLQEAQNLMVYSSYDLVYRIPLYTVILDFVKEVSSCFKNNNKGKIVELREEYVSKLEKSAKIIQETFGELLPKHLKILFWMWKNIINNWNLI